MVWCVMCGGEPGVSTCRALAKDDAGCVCARLGLLGGHMDTWRRRPWDGWQYRQERLGAVRCGVTPAAGTPWTHRTTPSPAPDDKSPLIMPAALAM